MSTGNEAGTASCAHTPLKQRIVWHAQGRPGAAAATGVGRRPQRGRAAAARLGRAAHGRNAQLPLRRRALPRHAPSSYMHP